MHVACGSDMLALYNPDEDTHDSGDEAPDSPRNLYPPVVVRKVLEAVCIILGVEPVEVARGRASVKADYWKPAKVRVIACAAPACARPRVVAPRRASWRRRTSSASSRGTRRSASPSLRTT